VSQSIEVKKNVLYDDEINLIEFVKQIWNKRFLIGIITLCFILFAFFLIFSKNTIYEVRAIFEVGSIVKKEEPANLENVDELIHKVNIIYNSNVPLEELTRLKGIKLLSRTDKLIELKVESTSNEKALAFLNEIVSGIKLSHSKIIDNYLALVNSKLSLLEAELVKLHANEKLLIESVAINENNIKRVLSDNAAEAIVYSINLQAQNTELSALKERIYTLEKNILKIKLTLLPVNVKQTEILGDVIISDYPIAPNKKLIVILAAMLGIIFSIILVLIMGFVRKYKEAEYDQ